MHQLETRNDLQWLVDEGIEESLTLEYKASPALARDSDSIRELCKDVSAMANSAGGQIVYGIEEDKKTHKPVRVDDGVTDPKITREWIEQVLTSNVQPRMDCVHIDRIDMENGNFGYVLTIDQSHTAHQAQDRKYYKRFELQATAMYDYEIRDVMRRATTPDLHILLSFSAGERAAIDFAPGIETSNPIALFSSIENRSNVPATYVLVQLDVHEAIGVVHHDKKWSSVFLKLEHHRWRILRLTQRLAPPHDFPVFREIAQPLDGEGLVITFGSQLLGGAHRLPIVCHIFTPGFSSEETWYVELRGSRLQLLPPETGPSS